MRPLKAYVHAALNRLAALRDWRTRKHIVVFESDDWGSIRMAGRTQMEALQRAGYSFDRKPYELDTLESPEDLEALFEVLSRHVGADGRHPVITANMLMANPDFEKIEADGYTSYHFETISQTYQRYWGDTKIIQLMWQGLKAGVFMPQSHGREHFNVRVWMKGLREGNEDYLTAFHYGMCGITPKLHPERGNKLMQALNAEDEDHQCEIDATVVDGLRMFEEFWGFPSQSFVAPCFCWNREMEHSLRGRVQLIQASRNSLPAWKTPSRRFYAGQRNKDGLVYNVRNASFEPVPHHGGNTLDELVAQTERAFFLHVPLVFTTHRINYVSGIETSRRDHTLLLLEQYLTWLLNKYPDTLFYSSDQLLSLKH